METRRTQFVRAHKRYGAHHRLDYLFDQRHPGEHGHAVIVPVVARIPQASMSPYVRPIGPTRMRG